ncbi:hypothetical protein KCU77_g2478, partial [Aureobasidium melanogenum]
MDEDSLRRTLRVMDKKLDQLTDILKHQEQRWEKSNGTCDPGPCLSLIRDIRIEIDQDADEIAEEVSEMIHHIADRVIEDTVDHLADKMRSSSIQDSVATTLIDLFFAGPQGDERRKDLQVRLKKKFAWNNLGSILGRLFSSFEQALSYYKAEVEEMALKYANEDMKKIVDAITHA